MTDGLGPLQAEAVTDTLTSKLDSEVAGATKPSMTYIVGGFGRQGAETPAPVVDRVLGDQIARRKTAAKGASMAPAGT
ncbi:hypothetical protein [uncultured Sphingomonas sp.]|uniref:hypothetical protein n=1 Tax=uncultured Sphingomonas sp. TaxID=158754 RepID=UPI003748AE02